MSARSLAWRLALGVMLLPTGTLSAQNAPSGSVFGSVVTRDDGRPLAARVWLVGVARPTAPNARGSFRFDRLSPGRYHLRATYIGFVPADTVVSVSAGTQLRVLLRLTATPVLLTGVTIREPAKPPPAVTPPKPVSLKPVVDCGRLFVVNTTTVLCTSPQLLARTTVYRDEAFLGSNSLILEAAQEAVGQAGFVTERLLQLNGQTWMIAARDPRRPVGIGTVRIEIEETGAHDTTVRVSLTSAASVSRTEQRDRALAYLSTIRRNLK